jgi:hypothetical protein
VTNSNATRTFGPERRWWLGLSALGLTLTATPACGGGGGGSEPQADDGGSTSDSPQDDDGPDDDGGDESGDETGAEPVAPEVPVGPGGIRRLRTAQYKKSVRVLLGPEAELVAAPPADQALAGFDAIGAAELALSPAAIEQYEKSAIDISEVVIENPGVLAQTVPCVTQGPKDHTCFAEVARQFGGLAWRRELSDDEIGSLASIANAAYAWAGNNFDRGVQYEVAAILQSPDFLYIAELGEDDGGTYGKRLTDRELVTRASLFVLGRVPDADMLAAADAGELATEEGLRAFAEGLVEHVDARTALLEFFDELLRLRELPLRAKDAELFPDYSADLAESMRQEALLVLHDILLTQDASFLSVFDADFTYVDPLLAGHYGIAPPASGVFEKVALPAGQGRSGILGLAGFPALFSHSDRTSPTRRGVFIQRTLLCREIPPPPGDVDTTLPEPEEPTTLRALMEMHGGQDGCESCHAMMDPIGFAFESFDATGAYRTTDNGFPVDTTGNIEGIGSFANAAELATLLQQQVNLGTCLVRNMYRHSVGHMDSVDQADAILWLNDAFVASDHNVKQLMVELVVNPVFRRVDAPK